MSPAPGRLTRVIPAEGHEQGPTSGEALQLAQPQVKSGGVVRVREPRATLREESVPREGLG
jgi:hypothetical protein